MSPDPTSESSPPEEITGSAPSPEEESNVKTPPDDTTATDGEQLEAFPLPDLEQSEDSLQDSRRNLELLQDVTLRVKVELGRGKMPLRNVLRLTDGSVVELDKLAGDPLEIFVNDRLIGRGEVLVLNENFCVRITQVYSPEECIKVRGIQ